MLKGAIIGIGKIAQECHLPAFQNGKINQDAEIIAAVDTNAESVALAIQKYPGLRYYKTIEELLSKEAIDFIDICSPPESHARLIMAGLRQGLHIMCEKPFVKNSSEADEIYAGLSSSTKVFMPVHQYKYSPIWSEFKSAIENTGENEKNLLQFNVFRTEADNGLSVLKNPWRTKPEISGGGILSDTGVHYLYLSLWMLGQPLQVTARTFKIAHTEYQVEDTAIVVLKSEKGTAEINLTWSSNRRFNSAYLLNKHSSLVYNGSELLKYNGEDRTIIPVPDASDKRNYILLYVSLIEEFMCRINKGSGDLGFLNEALESVKLLSACYKSAELNHTINIQ